MPDFPTIIAGAGLLLAGVALAGLAVLLLARRPLPGAPLAVHLAAIGMCLCLLLSLKLDGWPDLRGRVFGTSLALLAAWLGVALWAFALRRRPPLAAAFATAGAHLQAGFFLAVGAASLRHATPLAPPLALGAILFGLSLLPVPGLARPLPTAGRRACAVAAAVLLLAAGFHARRETPDWLKAHMAPQTVRPASAP